VSKVHLIWEITFLCIILLAYILLLLFGWRNQQSRSNVSSRSGVLSECEEYSVALFRHILPDVAVQEYRFRGMQPNTASIDIAFKDLNVSLKSDNRCILEGVTGEFRAGRMAAIMGPSGAGKTTFMNALCDKAYYGNTTGEIQINGEISSIAAIKQIRGFVPQDDIVHEHLTVREQLYYSAKLRNADGTTRSEINSILEDVLHVMHLLDVQHSIVGSVEKRGISGGQRKRVNIGLELAARPTVIFLDEPTSGLDATTALDIIHSLKRLTEIGMTVIMVIHQPRYSLFSLFDEVLLLGLGGHTVFLGPSAGVLPYFKRLGFQIPDHENPADWFMDVISGKVTNDDVSGFKPSMLSDFWKQEATNPTLQMQRGSSVRSEDETFNLALERLRQDFGINGEDVVTREDLIAMLSSAGISKASDAVLFELMQRIGFKGESVNKRPFINFLMSLRGCLADDALSSSDSDDVDLEGSDSDDNPFWKDSLRGRLGFCKQYPVLLHQNAIRWTRLWKQNVISMILMTVAGAVFGAQCKDKLTVESPLAPLKINLSHVALGLMTGISCLSIFGIDRPVFWRESSSGVMVIAFYLARVTISLFDVMFWCYIFTGVWFLASQAPCDFWTWLVAFRMTATSAAGWGVLVSTLVPQHSSTLAIAVVILIMGGAISEPQSIAEAPGTFNEILAWFSPFTWTSGENYLAFVDKLGADKVSPAAMPIVQGYQKLLSTMRIGNYLGYLGSSYLSCSILGLLSLALGFCGLRFSHRGKQQ